MLVREKLIFGLVHQRALGFYEFDIRRPMRRRRKRKKKKQKGNLRVGATEEPRLPSAQAGVEQGAVRGVREPVMVTKSITISIIKFNFLIATITFKVKTRKKCP